MANATANYGLVPVRYLGGPGGLPQNIECVVAAGYGASILYVGDPVILAGSGDPGTGMPTVQIAVGAEGSPSENLFGTIMGVSAEGPDSLNVLGSPVSTRSILQVCPFLPGLILRINHKTSGSASASAISLNDIGRGKDLRLGAGDSLTGKSGWVMDDTTGDATTGTQLRLIAFDNRTDNEFSSTVSTDTANVDCLVVVAQSFWYSDMGAGI